MAVEEVEVLGRHVMMFLEWTERVAETTSPTPLTPIYMSRQERNGPRGMVGMMLTMMMMMMRMMMMMAIGGLSFFHSPTLRINHVQSP
jgi:hypothetical protein